MATDITTLAIAIQSQEAERNLQGFRQLMLENSALASKLEKISIAVDTGGALAQIQALKTGYDDLADSIGGLGGIPDLSSANAGNMEAMKEFFAVTAEMSKAFRDEMTQLNDALQMLEANAGKVGAAGTSSTASMSAAVTVSAEYAAKVREVAAAQKELEKAVAQADAAMKATIEADEDAAAVKKRLDQAQRELAQVSKQLAATHRGMSGDIIELSQREEYLKNKVAELQGVYQEAAAAAEKFNQKLEDSANKADAARENYQRLNAELDAMPKPMANVNGGMSNFSVGARAAGTQLTKLARGFNSVAMLAGGAIPGVSGLGRALSMFGYVNPYLAGAAVAIGAIAAAVKMHEAAMQESLQGTRDFADLQVRITESYTEEAKEQQHQMERLVELSGREKLCNSEREEAVRLIEEIKEAMPGLGSVYNEITRDVEEMGIQYDEATGKIKLTTAALNEFYEVQERKRKEQLNRQKKAQEDDVQYEADEIKRQFGSVSTIGKVALGAAGALAQNFSFNPIGAFTSAKDAYTTGKAGLEVNSKISSATEALKNAKTQKERKEILDDLDAFVSDFRKRHGDLAKTFDLADVKKAIEQERKGIKALAKTDAELKKKLIGGRTEETVKKSVANLTKQLDEAKRAAMSPEARDAADAKRIAELEKRKELLAQEQDGKRLMTFDGKELTVDEWRLKTQTELAKLTAERAKREEQITKQLEAQQEKLRAFADKYNLNERGEVAGRTDSIQRSAARKEEIAKLNDEIANLEYRRDRTEGGTREWDKLQSQINDMKIRRNGLLADQFKEDEANKSAREQRDAYKNSFVYDRNGRVVRRKSALEMLDQRIAAQREKVKSSGAEGSTERLKAEADLKKLEEERLKMQQKNSTSIFANEMRSGNSTMMQGIRARSAEALRLESRNFNRPENGFKAWTQTLTKINDDVRGVGPNTQKIADKVENFANALEHV